MDLNVKVCDVCRAIGRDTERYTVGRDEGEQVELDLCNVHSRPLEALLRPQRAEVASAATPARSKPSVGRTSAPRRTGRKVVSVSDIEASKR